MIQVKNVYTIKSFRGGISGENDKGIRGAFKFGYGLNIRGRDDVLQCGQALVKETTGVNDVVVDKINFFVPASDGNTYGFGDAGNIYKRTSAGVWTKVYTDTNGAILGAEEWDGYLYWATATKVGRKELPGVSNWSDAVANWQTTLTSSTWHTMKIATGNLLICNAQYLALVDYATHAFNALALDLIPGNLAKCLDESGDYALIGSVRSDNNEIGHLWSWESTALAWIQKKKIAAKGINALITAELMFAQVGVEGEVYYSDMVSRVPAFVFPDGGYCLPGGVCTKKGLAVFGVFGNSSTKCGVYTYGRAEKNYPFALNLDYVPSPGVLTTIEIGAVGMAGGTMLVAWKNGSTYGVDAVSASIKATGVYESLEWDGGKPYQRKSFLQEKFVFSPLPSGCAIVFKYKTNKATDWTTAKTIDGVGYFSTAGKTRAIFNINDEGEIIEKRIELTPNGNNCPTIKSCNTYYTPGSLF